MALSNPPVLTNVVGKSEAVEVHWEQVAGSVLSYVIYYGTAPGVYSNSVNVAVASLTDPAAPSHIVSGLVDNATYWVAVSAIEVGTEEETAKSGELSAVTAASQIVLQPSNLRAASGNGTVILSWDSPVAVDGFQIEYTRDTNKPRAWNGTGATEGDSPITINGNVTQFTFTGLENNSGSQAPYFFRIRAMSGGVSSDATEEVVGIPQAGLTSPIEGSFTKIVLQQGLNLVAVPTLPTGFTPDMYNLGKFFGGTQILWKSGALFAARALAVPVGSTKTIEPMEAVLINMPSATTKYLIGDSWKNV